MTIGINKRVKCLITNILSNSIFQTSKKSRKIFFVSLLLQFLSVKGKLNFLQLQRYGTYSEQTYRNQYEQKFDFFSFNKSLIDDLAIEEKIIAFDPSFIPKSGKSTFGKGKYWSGVAGDVKTGLEIGGFAVVDVKNNYAFHLKAIQTPSSSELKNKKLTLLAHYADLVAQNAADFTKISTYLVADAYFSKATFVEKVLEGHMHFISRLRDDSVLYYNYKGNSTGKKGRPKKFTGRVDVNKLELNYFSMTHCCPQLQIHSAIVYCKAFKRNINLAIAIFIKDGKEIKRKLFFSTDLNQQADTIVSFYRARFQIEFLYRDAKQHTGLTHSQARSENKLDFHFNASLTAVNLAKQDWIKHKQQNDTCFSMADYKTQFNNTLMIDLFIAKFAINPNTKKNRKIVEDLLNYGKIAA